MGERSPDQRKYLKILAAMKRRGLKVADMPEDVAQSALFLHQHFLTEEYRKRHGKTDERQRN